MARTDAFAACFRDGRFWRNRRLQPKTAFLRLPPVHRTDLKSELRSRRALIVIGRSEVGLIFGGGAAWMAGSSQVEPGHDGKDSRSVDLRHPKIRSRMCGDKIRAGFNIHAWEPASLPLLGQIGCRRHPEAQCSRIS